jgi:hypothetical protein
MAITKNDQDPQFVQNLLSTDEANFTRDGVFNSHDTHVWSEENPNAIHEGPSRTIWHKCMG